MQTVAALLSPLAPTVFKSNVMLEFEYNDTSGGPERQSLRPLPLTLRWAPVRLC